MTLSVFPSTINAVFSSIPKPHLILSDDNQPAKADSLPYLPLTPKCVSKYPKLNIPIPPYYKYDKLSGSRDDLSVDGPRKKLLYDSPLVIIGAVYIQSVPADVPINVS